MSSESKRRYDISEKGKATKNMWLEKNKDKQKESQKKYQQSEKGIIARRKSEFKNKEHRMEYQKRWAKEHPEKCREKQIRFYKKNPGYMCEKQKIYYNSEKGKQTIKQRELSIKLEVFSHYSPDDIKCALRDTYHPDWDITDLDLLSIDHINGGGSKHRKELNGKSGYHFYHWLKQQGFPEGYRVLCWNCQIKEKIRLKDKIPMGNRSIHPRKYPTTSHSVGQGQPDTPRVSPVE